jgi:enoyl-CoA hydratase/carnithine racemase
MEIQADRENKPLLIAHRDGVATVTINRPGRKNAISHAMWRELSAIAGDLGNDPATRVIILRGAGHDFSAGADISEFDTVRRDAATARDYEAANSAAFAAFRNAQIPVIAAIRGICFGGGFGLAAACDLRIATPDALFSVPQRSSVSPIRTTPWPTSFTRPDRRWRNIWPFPRRASMPRQLAPQALCSK